MPPHPPSAAHSDAAYHYFSNLMALRARRVPKPVLQARLEDTFLELCGDLSPTVSLEIGAHEASFSTRMKERTPTARCLAFEANPYVHEKYAAKLAGAGVEYLHLAVGETNGPVTLTIPRRVADRDRPQTNRMSSVAGAHRYQKDAETVSVPSVPLDEFVTLTEDDTVVAWIDVEGASGIVLPSARATLERTSLVFIEVESEQVWDGQWLDVDVARYLTDLGFVPMFRDIQRPHQYNVVFASGELAADPRMARVCNRLYRRHRPDAAAV